MLGVNCMADVHCDDAPLLMKAMLAGLAAARGQTCLLGHLIPKSVVGRTVLIAAGKAAASMMAGACDILGPGVEGIVLTRYGHCGAIRLPTGIEMIEAAHPVPDANGEAAARRILALAESLSAGDRLVFLISGGASALLSLPAAGITLAEKQALNRALLASGASIAEMNCVRKHVSAIKGGRLALAAYPAKVETYCISDVPGDDPALIGSGPTVPDNATQADARAVLARYGIEPSPGVAAVLADPAHALPAPDHPAFAEAQVRVVARPLAALEAAAGVVAAVGYQPVILGDAIEGEARKVGAEHAALALACRARGEKVALLSGGECTVRLGPEAGRGGPNTEYLMALALGLDGATGISALAVDTDGIDGSADNAGAMIDPTTLARAAAAGIDWRAALDANRSYDSFAALGNLVMTRPTLTNVNDLRIILIEP